MAFLHHVIESDSDESNDYRSVIFRDMINQDDEDNDNDNESSLGSFVFGHEAIHLDESELESHESGSEIG